MDLIQLTLENAHLRTELHGANLKIESLEAELQNGKSLLRHVCKHFGDTDYPENEHLYNIVEKHLARHLFSQK